jgi:hypothetical protein
MNVKIINETKGFGHVNRPSYNGRLFWSGLVRISSKLVLHNPGPSELRTGPLVQFTDYGEP